MESCKNCMIFNKSDDDMRRLRNDTGLIDTDAHFCLMYERGIDKRIYNGEKDCPYFLRKDDD